MLDIELPGYAKDEVSAELKDGYLTISAKKNQENESKDKKFIRKERYTGSCKRTFYVGIRLSRRILRLLSRTVS